MQTVYGWINVYRNGHFHRAGKPNMFDRHGGDIYPSESAAIEDIDHECGQFVATTSISWLDPDHNLRPNGADSVPIKLTETRGKLPSIADSFREAGPSQLHGMRPLVSQVAPEEGLHVAEVPRIEPWPALPHDDMYQRAADEEDAAEIDRINRTRVLGATIDAWRRAAVSRGAEFDAVARAETQSWPDLRPQGFQ